MGHVPAALEQRHVDVLARNISNGRQLCLTQDQSIATVGGDPAGKPRPWPRSTPME